MNLEMLKKYFVECIKNKTRVVEVPKCFQEGRKDNQITARELADDVGTSKAIFTEVLGIPCM